MKLAALLLLLCTPSWSRPLVASFYSEKFNGRLTATGDAYDSTKHTAASRTFKFGTCLELKDRKSGRSTRVLINDYGPSTPKRDLDISKVAADEIGLTGVKAYDFRILPKKFCQVVH
jgi:rare lipoprotein A